MTVLTWDDFIGQAPEFIVTRFHMAGQDVTLQSASGQYRNSNYFYHSPVILPRSFSPALRDMLTLKDFEWQLSNSDWWVDIKVFCGSPT
jgi:hypothetical protein